jgi:putrescine:ornithine antiporter
VLLAYAIYACGEAAVFGAMLVLAFGYLLYGFLARRFVQPRKIPGRSELAREDRQR